MENHHFWFVEKKMVIFIAKLMTKYPQRFDIKITFYSHFTQDKYLVGLTFNPNIHYKPNTYSLSMFEGTTSRNTTQ
jgi:hypothetical protein